MDADNDSRDANPTEEDTFTYDQFVDDLRSNVVHSWGRVPYSHQMLACVQMLSPFRDPTDPPCAFLGEATGRSKSLFQLATFTAMGGINITCVPLITLAAQQVILATLCRNMNHGSIHIYHLDIHKEPHQVQEILGRVEE
mmetsp:Transcript_48503/g.89990  ORF Transcript_48503/g.89990 Transcript_48503/m.89990 type:complete len:140 (-) Transcript_48503:4700-5119(-)